MTTPEQDALRGLINQTLDNIQQTLQEAQSDPNAPTGAVEALQEAFDIQTEILTNFDELMDEE